MTLVIRDQLVCPPTWFMSFRDLTLYCNVFMHLDIVLESDDADVYYQWIKSRGGMDFVADIVRPGTEPGLRLDTEFRFAGTIVVDRIIPENTHRLLAEIRALAA